MTFSTPCGYVADQDSLRERECYTLCGFDSQTKQAPRVGGSDVAERVDGRLARPCKFFQSVDHPGRLIPSASERHRREIRRVGLDQQTVVGNQPQQVVVSPFLEGDNPAERDIPSGSDGKFGQLVRTR